MKIKGVLVILLVVWALAMIFPMAWFMGLSPVTHEWFNRHFHPLWVHVVMHAGMYAVLCFGLASLLGNRRGGWVPALALLAVIAFLQEGLQKLTSGTAFGAGEWFDFGVDLAGAAVGLGVWWVVRSFTKKTSPPHRD